MKFTDLSPSARAVLAALCASNTLTTDRLGRCCTPQKDAGQAAVVLLEMRKWGLAYSHQKAAGQTYCNWYASEHGRAVFEGRPDDVQPVHAQAGQGFGKAGPEYTVAYLVVDADGKPDASWSAQTNRDHLVSVVQSHLTNHPGAPALHIIEQKVRKVATVTAPVKPTAQVELF